MKTADSVQSLLVAGGNETFHRVRSSHDSLPFPRMASFARRRAFIFILVLVFIFLGSQGVRAVDNPCVGEDFPESWVLLEAGGMLGAPDTEWPPGYMPIIIPDAPERVRMVSFVCIGDHVCAGYDPFAVVRPLVLDGIKEREVYNECEGWRTESGSVSYQIWGSPWKPSPWWPWVPRFPCGVFSMLGVFSYEAYFGYWSDDHDFPFRFAKPHILPYPLDPVRPPFRVVELIVIVRPLTVRAEVSSSAVSVGDLVTFSAWATCPEGEYSWQFPWLSDSPVGPLTDPTIQMDFDEPGTYTAALTYTRNGYQAFDNVSVVVYESDPPLVVDPPYSAFTVYAGQDQEIFLPATVMLAPLVVDENGDVPEGLNFSWTATRIEGNGTVAFDPADTNTSMVEASFSAPGVYDLILTVELPHEGEKMKDSFRVRVWPEQVDPDSIVSSEGADYWVTFLESNQNERIQIKELVLSSSEEVWGFITEYLPEFDEDRNLISHSTEITPFQVGPKEGYHFLPSAFNGLYDPNIFESGVVSPSAIRIQSTSPITVHGLSATHASTDGFLALPTGLLGQEYILAEYYGIWAQGPGSAISEGTFSVVATQDATTCHIFPLASLQPFDEFALVLLESDEELPEQGDSIAYIRSDLEEKLHFRIFDKDGAMIVDKGEDDPSIDPDRMEVLKETLSANSSWLESGVGDVVSVVGFEIVLQAGEVVRYKLGKVGDIGGTSRDLTGTRITSNNPVAVFSGSKITFVPSGAAGDTIIEQNLPVEFWGRSYLVLPMREPGDFATRNVICEFSPEWSPECEYDFTGELVRISAIGGEIEGDIIVSIKKGDQIETLTLNNDTPFEERVLEGAVKISADGHIEVSLHASTPFSGDVVRVIASEDDTYVSINGVASDTPLKRGEYISLDGSTTEKPTIKQPSSITANKPVQVVQFMPSAGFRKRTHLGDPDNTVTGDPLMALLPSVEQFNRRLQYHAFGRDYSNDEPFQHFVGIIAKEEELQNLVVNDTPLEDLIVRIPKSGESGEISMNEVNAIDLFEAIADSKYVAANIPVEEGYNLIESSRPFFGIGWGVYPYESYGFRGAIAVNRDPGNPAILERAPLPLRALINHRQEVAVRVLDAAGRPLSGHAVDFTISLGHTGQLQAVSDGEGWARISYTATSTGSDRIVAALDDLQVSWNLEWRDEIVLPEIQVHVNGQPSDSAADPFAREMVFFEATAVNNGESHPIDVLWETRGGFEGVTIDPSNGPAAGMVFPLPGQYVVRATAVYDGYEISAQVPINVRAGSSVRLVSPRQGDLLRPDAGGNYTIPIKVEAFSDVGIANVMALVDGPLGGADRTITENNLGFWSPFTSSHLISPPEPGEYVVTARLTDKEGVERDSDPVSVQISDSISVQWAALPAGESIWFPEPFPVRVDIRGGVAPYLVRFRQGSDGTGPLLTYFPGGNVDPSENWEQGNRFDWATVYGYAREERSVRVEITDSIGQTFSDSFYLGDSTRSTAWAEILQPLAGARLSAGGEDEVRVRVYNLDGVSGTNVDLSFDGSSILDGGHWVPVGPQDLGAFGTFDYVVPEVSLPVLPGDVTLRAEMYPWWASSEEPQSVTESVFTVLQSELFLGDDIVVDIGDDLFLPFIEINPPNKDFDAYLFAPDPDTLTYLWSHVSGPSVTFADGAARNTQMTFAGAGEYVVRLVAGDATFTVQDELKITINAVAGGAAPEFQQITFPPSEIEAGPEGASGSIQVEVVSSSMAPVWVDIYLASNGSSTLVFSDSPENGLANWAFDGLQDGSYAFRVVARDEESGQAVEQLHTMTVIGPGEPDPDDPVAPGEVRIVGLANDPIIVAPVTVKARASLAEGTSYRVEYRPVKMLDDQNEDGWVEFDHGEIPAGDGTESHELGEFDPSLLRNGFYEVRVVAGGEESESVPVIVDGKRKVGNFAIAFKDLSLPFAGIPIEVIRSYDTRDADRMGAFGHGWNLSVGAVSLRMNRSLGEDWIFATDYDPNSGYTLYSLTPGSHVGGPDLNHLITISLPDDTVQIFKASVEVIHQNEGFQFLAKHMDLALEPNESHTLPFEQVRFTFHPYGVRTRGSLEISGGDEASKAQVPFREVGTGSVVLEVNGGGNEFKPTRFIYTAEDGTRYLISEADGLERITDPRGQTLTVDRESPVGGVNRVSAIRLVPQAGEPERKVEIGYYNETNRIEFIQDPYGQQVRYSYYPAHDLKTVTDRSLAVTSFQYYDVSPKEHFLKKILKTVEGEEEAILFNHFDDADGRLIRQDFYGNPVEFDRNEPNVEKITDRLGYQTAHQYDDNGNIIRTTLPVKDASGRWARIEYEFGDLRHPHAVTKKSELFEEWDASTEEWMPSIITNYTYNEVGRLHTETRFARNPITGIEDELKTTYTYDALGNPLVITDPLREETTYTYYDKAIDTEHPEWHGLPKTIVDAEKNLTQFTQYDDWGNLLVMVDADNKTTTYKYDEEGLGRLQWQIDASGARIDYAYDGNGRVRLETRTIRAIDGAPAQILETEYRYDGEGRVILTLHPESASTEPRTLIGTAYDENGMLKRSYEPIEFPAGSNLDDFDFTSFTAWTEHDYDAGNLTKTTYPTVNVITGFDAQGEAITTSAIYTEEWEYDKADRRILSKDREDRWTRSYYDPLGRLIATYRLTGAMTRAQAIAEPIGAGTLLSASVYDAAGRLTDSYDARGYRTHYTYDGAGRRTHVIPPGPTPAVIRVNADGDALTFEGQGVIDRSHQTISVYDPAGNVREIHEPHEEGFRVTRHQFDAMNRRVGTLFPDRTSVSQTHDSLGRLETSTDAEGKLTRYRYDAMGRLWQVRQYLNSATADLDEDFSLSADADNFVLTEFFYDDAGRQVKQIDARENSTRYTYDEMGRRKSRKLPGDQTENYEYDPAGNLRSRTDFRNETTEYIHDELGRLKERVPAASARGRGALRAVFSYWAGGQRRTQTLFNASNEIVWAESYEYDPLGRLDLKSTPAGDIDYIHDNAGNVEMIAASASDGTASYSETHYRYDSRNRLARVEDRTAVPEGVVGRVTNYGYTPKGALDHVVSAGGLKTTYEYDDVNRLRGITVERNLTTVARFDYDLRPGGHRERLTEAIGIAQVHGIPRITTWDYDGLYRLREEIIDANNGVGVETVTYDHDKVGNRKSRSVTTGLAEKISPVGLYGYDNNDRLTELEGVQRYDHDENGNTTDSGIGAFPVTDIYDDQNRLIQRVKGEEESVNILYDADGNRVRKTVREGEKEYVTYYLVDALNPTGYPQVLVEVRPTRINVKSYTYGLDRISQRNEAGVIHYYGYDGLGSVRYLTDSSGQITERYSYDSFGNLLDPWPAASPSGNVYRYAGEEWDADLKLYYNRARYLDPTIGRFWTMDQFEGVNTTPASLHKYLYAHADPVNNIDPTGKYSLISTMATGAGLGILGQTAVVTINTRFFTQSYEGDLLRDYIEAAGYGAVGGGVGGKLFPYFLQWGKSIRPLLQYGRFGAGTATGALSGASVASFKEFIDFYFLGQPTTVRDSSGRVWSAVRGGFITGGIFTVVTPATPRSGSPSEVRLRPASREIEIYTPLPLIQQGTTAGAIPGPAASLIEMVVQQGIEELSDFSNE